MAKSFHINPATGEVGRCRAFISCRFDGKTDHFNSEAEARAAYEEANAHQTLKAVVKNYPPISAKVLAAYEQLFSKTRAERIQGDRLSFRDGRHDSWQKLYKAMSGSAHGRALDIYYGEESSERINRYLREGPSSKAISEQGAEVELAYYEAIDMLDSYIRTMSKRARPELLYKGAEVKSKTEYATLLRELAELKPGSTLRFPGYTSTSLSATRAENFMYGKGILYEIHSSKGAFTDEEIEEVLLARVSTFIYVGYEELDNAILVRLKQED